jgi:hypothetical protein
MGMIELFDPLGLVQIDTQRAILIGEELQSDYGREIRTIDYASLPNIAIATPAENRF